MFNIFDCFCLFRFYLWQKTKKDHSLWLYSFGAISIYFSVVIIFGEYECETWYSTMMFLLSGLFFYIALIIKRKMFLFLGLLGSIACNWIWTFVGTKSSWNANYFYNDNYRSAGFVARIKTKKIFNKTWEICYKTFAKFYKKSSS